MQCMTYVQTTECSFASFLNVMAIHCMGLFLNLLKRPFCIAITTCVTMWFDTIQSGALLGNQRISVVYSVMPPKDWIAVKIPHSLYPIGKPYHFGMFCFVIWIPELQIKKKCLNGSQLLGPNSLYTRQYCTRNKIFTFSEQDTLIHMLIVNVESYYVFNAVKTRLSAYLVVPCIRHISLVNCSSNIFYLSCKMIVILLK